MQNNSDNQKPGLSWSAPASTPKPATPAPSMQKSAPVTTPTGPSTAKYVGMIVVGVIIGVLIAWAWSAAHTPTDNTQTTSTSTSQNSNDNSTATTDTNSDSGTPAEGSDPSLLVMSPQKAGSSVAISKAIVTEPTWVVIYENKGGKPGNALGAALFFPEAQAGTVELLRPTVAGNSYLVVKQVDNGDRKFSLHQDQILTEGGQTQWVMFDAN